MWTLDPDKAKRFASSSRVAARRLWAAFVRYSTSGLYFTSGPERAQAYLSRVVALTGARKIDGYYLLEANGTRFYITDRQIARTSKSIRSRVPDRQTCFLIPDQSMPIEEKIASALLQLKSNPALFDCWARQCGPFKANGELFVRRDRSIDRQRTNPVLP
jgi:hypothetical protein